MFSAEIELSKNIIRGAKRQNCLSPRSESECLKSNEIVQSSYFLLSASVSNRLGVQVR
jgi:hypothetical protein